MAYDIGLLEQLLKNKEVEVQEGVSICCEKQIIHLDIYLKDDNIVIEFAAPFTYLRITKLGIKSLVNIVNPRIESITITDKSYDVKVSTLGVWKFARD